MRGSIAVAALLVLAASAQAQDDNRACHTYWAGQHLKQRTRPRKEQAPVNIENRHRVTGQLRWRRPLAETPLALPRDDPHDHIAGRGSQYN